MSDGTPAWLIIAIAIAAALMLAQCQPPSSGPNCRDVDPTPATWIECD